MRNLGGPPVDGCRMTAISAATSRPLDLTATIATPPQPNVAPAGPDYDALFQASARAPDVSRMPLTHAGASGVQTLAPATGVSSNLQKLDALEAQLAGPYRIPGQPGQLSAPPTFHSNYARSEQLQARPQLHELAQRACKGLGAALAHACSARPTAQELVRVTQALIDAGALRVTGQVSAQDIRDLQARFCIGIDCIGFVREAQRALHGPHALAEATRFDGCTNQLEASHLFHVRKGGLDAAAQARTGDVIHLAPSASTESRQHNVVVRSNDVLAPTDPRCRTLTANGGADFLRGGPLHLIQVVCSGGGADDVRGVRRESWLYNESTKAWAAAERGKLVAVPGPGGHTRGSVYAARGGER